MIANAHPIVAQLERSPWNLHLVGSRYVGKFDRDKSDYDFILVVDGYSGWTQKIKPWLSEAGFAPESDGHYGPDRALVGSSVWTRTTDGHPSVDVLPMMRDEADKRLRFFRAMKSVGDGTGLIALGLKRHKAWHLLWEVIGRMETLSEDGS